jgi:hypothetical protein
MILMDNLSQMREAALERAGGRCEWAYCNDNKWLELAHIHGIGMGGNKKRKFDMDNVAILCKWHHDVYDGRQQKGSSVAYRALLQGFLKRKYVD